MLIDELNAIGYICSDEDKNILKKMDILDSEGKFASPKDIDELLKVDEDKFLRTPGIGNKYNFFLRKLKKRLHKFLDENKTNTFDHIPISQVRKFINDVNIVLEKVLNSNEGRNINYLSDFLSYNQGIFDKNSEEYKTFNNLRNILSSHFSIISSQNSPPLKEATDNPYLRNYCFNFSKLTNHQQSLILHLESQLGIMTLLDLLNLNCSYINEINLSKQKMNIYNEFLLLINEYSEIISENETVDSSLTCLSCNTITFLSLERIVIDDLENYLLSLNKNNQYIILSRLGYTQEEKTLEQIGLKVGLTRERVRQIECNSYDLLRHFLRIHPKAIWEKIEESFENLTSIFPNLFNLFDSQKSFFEFIEIITNKQKGFITNQILPYYPNNILDELFVLNPSPVSKDSAINHLITEFGYSNLAAISVLNGLEKKGIISFTEGGIIPHKLSQSSAVAHALTFHPKGLPWGDVSDIVNRNSFSSCPLDDKRVTHGFKSNDYVYLYGRGIYRNLIFTNIENINYEKILLSVREILITQEIKTINLFDFFNEFIDEPVLKKDYYLFRHLVSTYGDEFGLYFSGRSSSDILSVGYKVESHSQENIILNKISRSKVPVSTDVLASSIKSKSICHANLYLNNLLKKNKIVRVGRNQYSTPNTAFSGINKEKILAEIEHVLRSTKKIVELDLFREKINLKYDYSFSKYFYGSFISYYSQSEKSLVGIKKINNFVSNHPFKISTFSELIEAFTFNKVVYIEDIISKIKEVVWITSRVEQMLKSNLRHNYELEYRPKNI